MGRLEFGLRKDAAEDFVSSEVFSLMSLRKWLPDYFVLQFGLECVRCYSLSRHRALNLRFTLLERGKQLHASLVTLPYFTCISPASGVVNLTTTSTVVNNS